MSHIGAGAWLPLALAASLPLGCAPQERSSPRAQVVRSERAALQLGDGDRLIGSYSGCATYKDGEPWQVVVNDPAASSARVVRGDQGCQLHLRQLQRGADTYTLVSPADPGTEAPIRIGESYDPASAAAARRSDGVLAALVGARGQGLDFSGPSFTLEVMTGTTADEIFTLTQSAGFAFAEGLAAASELPAPDYRAESAGAQVLTDLGYKVLSVGGSFRLTFTSYKGTRYLLGSGGGLAPPADRDQRFGYFFDRFAAGNAAAVTTDTIDIPASVLFPAGTSLSGWEFKNYVLIERVHEASGARSYQGIVIQVPPGSAG